MMNTQQNEAAVDADPALIVDGIAYSTLARANAARGMRAPADEARQPTAEEEEANAAAAPRSKKARKAASKPVPAPVARKPQVAKASAPQAKKAAKAPVAAKAPKAAPVKAAPVSDKAANKGDIIVALLRRPEGSTLAQMQEATGWQPHSVRGFLAGTLKKKKGLAITSNKVGTGTRIYRLDPMASADEEAIG